MGSLQATLLRFYLRQILFSCGVSVLGTALFGTLVLSPGHLDTSLTAIYISLMIAGVFAALSLTLFLNVNEFIRNRILLSGIVWIVPPCFLLAYVIYLVPGLIGWVTIIPYLIGLVFTFWRFRIRSENTPKLQPLEIVTRENRKIRYGSNSDGMPPGGDMAM